MNADLLHIEKMLAERHRSKNAIMTEAISERLTKSLLTYEKELDAGCEYISSKNEIKVLKKL